MSQYFQVGEEVMFHSFSLISMGARACRPSPVAKPGRARGNRFSSSSLPWSAVPSSAMGRRSGLWIRR